MRYKNTNFDDYQTPLAEQKEALDSCKAIAAGKKSFVMHGNYGTGKTMLANCIVNEIGGAVITASSIARAFRDAIKTNSPETPIFDDLRKFPMLVIDEIGAYELSTHEYKLLNEVIDMRYRDLKPTGLITNLNIADLRNLVGERVIDRLKDDGGVLISFNWESQRG